MFAPFEVDGGVGCLDNGGFCALSGFGMFDFKLLRILLCISTLFCCHLANAVPFTPPTGYSIAAGGGEPDNLRGMRVAAQWDWDKRWFRDALFDIRGFWDMSLAVWHSDGDVHHRRRSLGVFGLAPMFRLQGTERLSEQFSPYFQASVGLSLITRNHLGRRDLGKNWQFQDFLGVGTQFGKNLAWDIGLHYLHYSNAGFNPPNQGIDVKLLVMLQYHA